MSGRINNLEFENTSEDEAYGGDGIELADFGQESFPDKKRKRKQIQDNFLVSDPDRGGDPDKVDTMQDLAFPVVDPNGDLDSSNDTLHKGPLQDADTLDSSHRPFHFYVYPLGKGRRWCGPGPGKGGRSY